MYPETVMLTAAMAKSLYGSLDWATPHRRTERAHRRAAFTKWAEVFS